MNSVIFASPIVLKGGRKMMKLIDKELEKMIELK